MQRMTTVPGMLDAAELDEAIANGEIDTVLVVFPDLQGRLVGKRVTGHYWSEQMHGGARAASTRATTCSPSTST